MIRKFCNGTLHFLMAFSVSIILLTFLAGVVSCKSSDARIKSRYKHTTKNTITPPLEKTAETSIEDMEPQPNNNNNINIDQGQMPFAEKKDTNKARILIVSTKLDFDIDVLKNKKGLEVLNTLAFETLYIQIKVEPWYDLSWLEQRDDIYSITEDVKRMID